MALPPFLGALEDRDPQLARAVDELWSAAQSGPLDEKTRILITMALDAQNGAADGVAALAKQARAVGAIDEEIAQALRLAYLVSGVTALLAGNAAFPS